MIGTMDSESEPPRGEASALEAASILGDPRQRWLLATLLKRSRPVTARDLAVQLAARETGTSPSALTRAELRPARVALRHRCLPQLESVGWIDRTPSGIVASDPSPTDLDGLVLPELRDHDHPSWDAISVLLARPRRLDVVSILADRGTPLAVTDLVAELRSRYRRRNWPSDDATLFTALHHLDLPKLASVDLLEYDADEGLVAPTPRLSTFAERTALETG